MILNAIVPIRFLYAKAHGKEETEKLIALMMSIEPEQNSILKNYEKIGAKIVNALDSQAYLELKKTFCDAKKCLHCSIGNKIIKNA